MNTYILTFFIYLISFSINAYAENLVGLVDIQAIIINSDEGKFYKDKYDKEIFKKEEVLIALKKELEKLDYEINNTKNIEAKNKKIEILSDKYKFFLKEKEKYDTFIKQTEDKLKKQITSNIYSIVDRISKKNKIDLVFDINAVGLVYVKNPINLTKETLDEYNKQFSRKN